MTKKKKKNKKVTFKDKVTITTLFLPIITVLLNGVFDIISINLSQNKEREGICETLTNESHTHINKIDSEVPQFVIIINNEN